MICLLPTIRGMLEVLNKRLHSRILVTMYTTICNYEGTRAKNSCCYATGGQVTMTWKLRYHGAQRLSSVHSHTHSLTDLFVNDLDGAFEGDIAVFDVRVVVRRGEARLGDESGEATGFIVREGMLRFGLHR